TGALFTIPASMVADTIDLAELETGISTEGVYFGSMTFFYKLAQSITVFIIGGLLTFIGFNSHLTVQAPDTRLYLGLILGLGVAISMLLSYWSISKYSLTKESILSIQAKLQARALETPIE
ncbi:MAG: MFS transporter, partial [Erysipelotrichaceae bacterium]